MPRFLSQIDTSRIPVKGLIPEASATTPANPIAGQMYYDTVLQTVRAYLKGAWVNLDADTNTMYNTGTTGEVNTGTDIAPKVWSPKTLKESIVANAPVATKATVGLGNVDNTSDANKPVSTATQTALNGKANTVHTHTASQITDLTTAIDNRVASLDLATDAEVAAALALYYTKTQTDALIQGLSPKQSVRVATTGNITTTATQTIDGVALAVGDRVLVKNQTAAANNGIYVVSSTAWTRAADADTAAEIRGSYCFVEEGTANNSTGWLLQTDNITLGTTPLVYVQFTGAGQLTPGNGLDLVGNTLSVKPSFGISVSSAGVSITPNGINSSHMASGAVPLNSVVTSGILPIAKGGTGASDAVSARYNLGAVGRFSIGCPAMTAGTWYPITHNLGSQNVDVRFKDSMGEMSIMDWKVTDDQSIAIRTDVSWIQDSDFTVLVIG